MKTILISFLLFLAPAPQVATTQSASEAYVYICTGPQSKRYHKTDDCYGLKNCSKDIKKVTLSYAVEIGRTPCKWCYK